MGGFNVVALISGGKDSLFSILHCQANGHQVVALANLHPPHDTQDGPSEDLESYMYQTIGHAVVPLYERALGLPLYRQEIIGDAVNQDKSYGPNAGGSSEDETEALLPLLRNVIAAHAEVNAVSTGAILSDYQRTRVESVAIRLGLTPLSYLWQWPTLPPQLQNSLLEDMAAVGQDSRIIKVASGGLDDSFLWQNVADRRTIARLTKAAECFGNVGDGAVLGEGGEYETLAVSGPAPLWKGRIAISESDIRTVQGDAGSASVKISNPSVVPVDPGTTAARVPRVPPMLEPRFEEMIGEALSENTIHILSHRPIQHSSARVRDPRDQCFLITERCGDGADAAEQTRNIMREVSNLLKSNGQDFSDVVYTTIVLRNMADFAAVNAVYRSYFTKPNPPARLTIACADAVPPKFLLAISIISAVGQREGLHVQSRSYWAPANIGPYSQAIRFPPDDGPSTTAGFVYIAGQIPLVPASMALPQSLPSPEQTFTQQAVLALQHLDRIGRVMKVKQWTFGIAFIAPSDDGAAQDNRAGILRRAWQAFQRPQTLPNNSSDEAEEFDVWHLTHGSGAAPWRVHAEDEEDTSKKDQPAPPLVIIQADSLPRDSRVEWVGHGSTTTGAYGNSVPAHLQSLVRTFRDRIL